MPQAIPVAMLAIAAAGAGYQINASNEQADKADAAAASQKKAQDAAVADQQTQQTAMTQQQKDAQASQTADLNATSDKSKQMALAAGALGRSSTILTSPLGLTGSSTSGGGKTLLGA